MGRLRPSATIAEVGVVAALYAALTVLLQPASYGPLQFRVAEVLKPLVIWEPHLIAAFVLGNLLGNLASPYAGPWELAFMPLVNLLGAWGCHALGRRAPYAGAALYAVVVAAAVALMLAVLTRTPYGVLFPALLASEMILIVGGVPVMRVVLRAVEPARRRWRPHPES
ncbi:MAG TPA: QueT transporter family protein [bacterium]|nr:QueT transporter family protein [bacterium]